MMLRPLAVAVSIVVSGCALSTHRPGAMPVANPDALRGSAAAPVSTPAVVAPAAPGGYRLLTPSETQLGRVYDDGKRTFVQFSGALPPAGLMLFDENGRALPYTVSGNTVTLEGRHAGVLVRTPTHSSYAQALRLAVLPTASSASSTEVAAARAQVLEAQARLTGLAAQIREASKSGESGRVARIREELDQLDTQIAGINATLVRVRFAEGQAELALSAESRAALVAAARQAERVIVRGGVDAGPQERGASKLALARAVAARRLLVEGGVAPERVRAMYYTKLFVGPNATPEGRTLNRRVEFVLVGKNQQRIHVDRAVAASESTPNGVVIHPRPLQPVGHTLPLRTFGGVAGS